MPSGGKFQISVRADTKMQHQDDASIVWAIKNALEELNRKPYGINIEKISIRKVYKKKPQLTKEV